MSEPVEVSTASDGPGDSANPTRAIAGFWRRFGAFSIDVAVLWTLGRGLAFFAYDELVRLDFYGSVVGFVVTTLYWGWCNSWLGGGGTLGKWICGIEVVDVRGNRLSAARSFWRAVVLTLPYFTTESVWLLRWWVLAIGVSQRTLTGGSAYLVACNRRNRQGLHDVAARSFVVLRKTHGPVRARPTWMVHYWVLLLIAAAWFAYAGNLFLPVPLFPPTRSEDFKRAEHATRALQKPEFRGGVGGRFFFAGEKSRPENPDIILDADWHSRPANPESAAAQVVATLVAAMPDARQVKQIEVQLKYGYHIGIGSDFHKTTFVHTPDEWLRLAAK